MQLVSKTTPSSLTTVYECSQYIVKGSNTENFGRPASKALAYMKAQYSSEDAAKANKTLLCKPKEHQMREAA